MQLRLAPPLSPPLPQAVVPGLLWYLLLFHILREEETDLVVPGWRNSPAAETP